MQQIRMTTAENGYSRTFPLYFGDPSQSNIVDNVPQESFVVDSRFNYIIVASTDCTNDECLPVYDPNLSNPVVQNNLTFDPYESIGIDYETSGRVH